MKQFILFITLIGLCGYLVAQENTWEVYLRGKSVKSIDFDKDYVWAATDSFLIKLNKVDNSVEYYPYPDIVSYATAYFLKRDKDGVMWIARSERIRQSCRINSFDGNNWSKIDFNNDGPFSSLAVDKNNNKWIAGGSYLYKIEQNSCVLYTPKNSGLIYNDVTQVSSDKDGNIWVLNMGSYVNLIGREAELIKYDGDKWFSYYSGSSPVSSTMKIDNQGNPWIAWYNVIKKLDMTSNLFSEEINVGSMGSSHFHLHAIEGEHKFWGTRDVLVNNADWQKKGFAVYDGSDWKFFTTSNSQLPSDTVYQITIDADGTKWIGTAKGLAAFNENGLATSTEIYSDVMNEIELFPNPAYDFINLKMPSGLMNSRIDILTIQGKTIKTFSLNQKQTRMDVSNFPTGVYLIRIHSDENHVMKKFVKQ